MRKGESSEAGRLIVDEKSIKNSVEHIAAHAEAERARCKMFADFLGERRITQKILDEYKAAKLE